MAGFIGDNGADVAGRDLLIKALVARSKELQAKGDGKGSVAQLQRCLKARRPASARRAPRFPD